MSENLGESVTIEEAHDLEMHKLYNITETGNNVQFDLVMQGFILFCALAAYAIQSLQQMTSTNDPFYLPNASERSAQAKTKPESSSGVKQSKKGSSAQTPSENDDPYRFFRPKPEYFLDSIFKKHQTYIEEKLQIKIYAILNSNWHMEKATKNNIDSEDKALEYCSERVIADKDTLQALIKKTSKDNFVDNGKHGPISSWLIGNDITDFDGLFENQTSFNKNVEYWDVSRITSMISTFKNCTSFNNSLQFWDTSKVTNMKEMFCGCEKFDQPLFTWNVQNVEDMSFMFKGCSAYNSPMRSWKIHKVQNFQFMFWKCENFDSSLDEWCVVVPPQTRTFFCFIVCFFSFFLLFSFFFFVLSSVS
jgi:hypothetical protein